MLTQRSADSVEQVAAATHRGEEFGPLSLIDNAGFFDDRFLGGEISVKIAGAHAGFLRDILYRRGVKAEAYERPLARSYDVHTAFRVRGRLPGRIGGRGDSSEGHPGPHENERSFSCQSIVAGS